MLTLFLSVTELGQDDLPISKHFAGIDGISLDMCNIVDIRKQSNYEIAVRISTDVNNQGREFYTDLNGFQVWGFYHFMTILNEDFRFVEESRLLCFYCLSDVLLLLMFCGSSSLCRGLVCSVWLWYFLIILTYFWSILSSHVISQWGFQVWWIYQSMSIYNEMNFDSPAVSSKMGYHWICVILWISENKATMS